MLFFLFHLQFTKTQVSTLSFCTPLTNVIQLAPFLTASGTDN